MQEARLTIRKIAEAAGVPITMVRYYERCGLVAPSRRRGEWRRYRIDHINRVRFIRGARTLGFSLKEIGVLLKLEDGTDRRSLRRIATTQLEGTRRRIADLRRIERALARLIQDCETRAKSPRCPITRMIL